MKHTSAILKELAGHDGERIPMGEVMRRGGSRAHGLGLLLFALPETLPLPIPSISLILAIPLVVISAHLVLFGEGQGIPKQIRDRSIPVSLVKKVSKYLGPVFRTIERLSHPRFEALADRERLLGVACLLLAIILLLPIPFGNLLPAVCLAAIAFGMIQRDGVIVALGLVGAIACLALVFYAASMAGGIFR